MKRIKKGLTLIELLAVIGIMSIVMSIITTVFISTLKLNTSISDKQDLQDSATAIQRSMYNDIRRANIVVDGSYDSASNRWLFVGSNMDQNNAYCRLKGYKPLIYVEGITGSRAYYAYDGVNGEVRKITIPNDKTTTTVTVYFTKALEYDNTTLGTEWKVIKEEEKPNYSPPKISYNITEEVSLKGLVIKYDSTDDGIDNAVTYNDFTKVGAFIQKDNKGVEIGRFVIVKANALDSNGKNPWFLLQIKSESLVYYSKTNDNLLSKYVVKNAGVDGIVVTKNSSVGEGDSLKGYYNIQLYLKKKTTVKEFEFRVSTVDYGGDIK